MKSSNVAVTMPRDDDPGNELLAKMTVDQLCNRFAQICGVASRQIIELARIVCELDRRGFTEWGNLRGVNERSLGFLRRVGHGQMVAALVVNDSKLLPSVLNRAAALPIPDQQAIADNEPIEVVCGDGTRMIRPSELTPEQAQQVFASGRMRTLAEQRTWMDARAAKAQAKAVSAAAQPTTLMVDRKRKCANVMVAGRVVYTIGAAELASVLARITE